MEGFLAQLINGLALGSIYALMVTGVNLIYSVASVVQFAYPHTVVLSMYVAWYVLGQTGNNVTIAIFASVFSGIGISLITEPIFRTLTKRGAMIASFIASLGIGLIITDIMSHELHFGRPVAFPENIASREPIFRLGLATLNEGQLATFIGSIVTVVAFLYLLYRSKPGRAFRAMAQSPSVARILGIPITRMSILSYAISGLLGGVSAVFLIMALGTAGPTLGESLALKVIVVVLFIGLGNLKGGLIAALTMGVVETMVMGYIPGDWSGAVVFGVIMVVIMCKPQGLLSGKSI